MITSAAAAAGAAGAATLTASCYVNAGGALLGPEWTPVLVCVSLMLSVVAAVRRVGQLKVAVAASAASVALRMEGRKRLEASSSSVAHRSAPATRDEGDARAAARDVRNDELRVFLSRLEGTFVRNKRRSSTLDEVCELLRMPWLVRKAVLLVRGLELSYDAATDEIKIDLFSVIPWFRITETYPLDGDPQHHRRRDLRSGVCVGSARLWRRVGRDAHDADTGELCVELRNRWGEPYAGEESAIYSLVKRARRSGGNDGDNNEEEEYDLVVETYANVFANGACTYTMYGERS